MTPQDTGKVAAYFGMIPEMYRFGSDRRCVYQACDVMTHSSHQRRGLFRQLALETCRQAESRDPKFFATGCSGAATTHGDMRLDGDVHFAPPFYSTPRGLCRRLS